jgi:predicted AAA+ superfamily ATPase
MFFARTLTKTLENVSKTFPVVLITGPRQVGKTTLFEKSKESNRTYISLDDPQLRTLAKNDPNLFLQTYKTPLLIDEVQYAPELFPYIKMAVDKEKKKGMFWLTGSQQFNLMKGISESLAGRVAILELQGLSQGEKHKTPQAAPFLPEVNAVKKFRRMDVAQVYEAILRGSYPALFATPHMDKNIFYASYLKTYIERDIRTLINISDEHSFLKFMRVAAARTGQMINYSDMARDVDVSYNTIKAWLSILETSGLIYLLQPFYNNVASRAIKTPKLYFLDTGLCCYLSGWDNATTLSNGAMSGAMLETYVVSEILKSYWHNGLQVAAYYYRDKDKKEIDLLIDRNGTLYPIEIKRTASPKESDVKSFAVLNSLKVKIGTGGMVCLYPSPTPLTQNVNVIPVGYI